MDGRKNVRIDDLSKLTKVEELRDMLVEDFEAEPNRQRLFYRGKQVRTRSNDIISVTYNMPRAWILSPPSSCHTTV